MVSSGSSMAISRHMKNMQPRAEQTYFYDFLPLHLLLFVSITGLTLPFSNLFLGGAGHPSFSLIYEFFFIFNLIYISYCKLSNILFRPYNVIAKNFSVIFTYNR